MADQSIPLRFSVAPFPEGFQGDMDEHAQQLVLLMQAQVDGSFLTGIVLPPGSTLPSTDMGLIVMDGIWYFWDPVTGQYLPQSLSARPAKNYVKNGSYQIQQIGAAPALVAGVTKTYDMCLCRMSTAGVLAIAADVGPLAGADHDTCQSAIKYTVGTVVPTLGVTDVHVHEHLIEGSDLAPIQNEILSLSFLCWVNQPGVYSAYLASGARDESYCATFTISTPNVWTRVKIPNIPAIPTTGTWSYGEGTTGMYIGVVMACGAQYQTANTSQWNTGLFMAGTTQSNMVSVTNNQMKITAMRLEASPQCGFASINSFEEDYHDCIRYYFTTFNYQSVSAGVPIQAVAYSANSALFSYTFPRRMAKGPFVVPYGNNTTAGKVTNISTGIDYANAALAATQKGVEAQPGTLTATAGQVIAAVITADARLT